MGEKRGMKALEAWCRKVTDGYRDVAVQNMSSSWRDGLAFCAIIHHFRPDLIDYDSLSKENIQYNNELAFSVAEKSLGIPSLLDAEDMVKYSIPDKLSIMTYVSQFYQFFEGSGHHARSPVKTAAKHPVESPTSSSSSPGSPPGKVTKPSSPTSRRPELCQICQNRVYILERLIIDNKLYHRTCFRCCRCKSVLKPAAYVDGPSPGQYECTSCPDEEAAEKAALESMASSRLAQQNASARFAIKELSVYTPPRRTYDVKQLTSPTAEARKLFLSSSVTEVGEEGTPVRNSAVSEESSKPKQFSSVSSYLFGPKHVEETLLSSEERREAKDEVASEKSQTDVKSDELKECTSVRLPDLSIDAETSVTVSGEREDKPQNESTSALKQESELSETVCDNEKTTANSLDVSSGLRPVPSPRRHRKHDLTPPVQERSYDKSTEELFTTPRTSPQVHVRKKTKPAQTDRPTPPIPVRKTFPPPVRDVNISSTEYKRPVSEDVSSPSKCGKVVTGMPVIRPQISPRMISPSCKAEERSQSSGASHVEVSSQDAEKVIPKEASDMTDGTIEPVEGLRKSTASTDLEKPEGSNATSAGTELENHALETEISQSSNGEEKKMPPPRPQFPSALIKSSSPIIGKRQTDKSAEPSETKYPEDLNPFSEEDAEMCKDKQTEKKPSLNPFEESDEEFEDALNSEELLTSTPNLDNKRSESPKGINPFEDDDDEESVSQASERPVPLPRTCFSGSAEGTPITSRSASPSPVSSLSKGTRHQLLLSASSSPATSPPGSLSRETGQRYSFQESQVSISPTGSISKGTHKKRPAPRPPMAKALFLPEVTVEAKTSRSSSPHHQYHKKSPAPAPPPLAKTEEADQEMSEKTLKDLGNISLKMKETQNNQLSSPEKCNNGDVTSVAAEAPKCNTFGYWKRKKLAPPIPLPPKRQTVHLNWEEIESELAEIERKQLELEQQGVELEKAIRNRLQDDATDSGNSDEENDLVIQLFELVNQKNVLFRRQSELVYIKRQQRLEEEHAELEHQIRCLMGKPECTKSKEELEQEEVLISRLVEVVKQRNEIIESIETDRLREAAEDKNISEQLAIHQAGSSRSSLNSQGSSTSVDNVGKKEQKKKNGDGERSPKEKESSKEHDEDKDVDDVEVVISEKKKKHKKHKWF